MILRFTGRVLSALLLLVTLVFFVALVMGLGREGDVRALPSVVPSAARFTVQYLARVVQGDLGVIRGARPSASATPVIDEL
ncbi:MAG: hypothetical protein PVH62_06240, partial [Anaerolineae bacterium]